MRAAGPSVRYSALKAFQGKKKHKEDERSITTCQSIPIAVGNATLSIESQICLMPERKKVRMHRPNVMGHSDTIRKVIAL